MLWDMNDRMSKRAAISAIVTLSLEEPMVVEISKPVLDDVFAETPGIKYVQS